MFTRVVALFGLSLVFVVGSLAVAERVSIAQAPAPPAAGEPAAQVQPNPAAPQPAEPAPQAPAPVVTVPAPMPPEKPAIAEDKKESLPAKLLFAAKQLPTIAMAL